VPDQCEVYCTEYCGTQYRLSLTRTTTTPFGILLLLSQGDDTCRQVQARKNNEAEIFSTAWSKVKEGEEEDEGLGEVSITPRKPRSPPAGLIDYPIASASLCKSLACGADEARHD
jgi:hypothetical protein